MASLSNINGLFDVHSTGAILFSTFHGTSGQILRSNGNAAPTWVDASTVIGGPYLPIAGGVLEGATSTDTGINFTVGGNLFGTSATFSASISASGNSNSFGNTTIGALAASTGTFSASITAAGNSNSFGATTFASDLTMSSGAINSKNLLFSVATLPANNTPSINLRNSNNEFYWQMGTANTLNIVDYNYRDTIMGIAQTSTVIVANPSAANIQNPVLFLKTNVAGYNAGISFINNGNTNSYNDLAGIASFIDSGDAKGRLEFWTRNTDGANTDVATRMTIKASGRVGIGTDSPGNLLDVAGDTDISGQLFVQHSGSYIAKLKQLATSMSNATYTFQIDNTAHTSNLSTAGAMSVDVDSGRAFTINGLGRVGIGTISPTQPLDVNGYSICDKQFQRDNSTTIILGTPRILNIGYRGGSGTYDFNPVTLFGNNPQGGQCEIQVTGWQNKVNNGFIYWRDNGSNTNIGNGIVGFVQTAVVGSGVISVSTNAGGNVITITFTGWHNNAHGWNAKIISNNS